MKPVGVVTYLLKHRKTYDTLCLLKAKGYADVKVYAVPFHYTKTFKPIFQHRPELVMDYPNIKELCAALEYPFYSGGGYTEFDIEDSRILLLCGAGLLSHEFIDHHTIINAHPGYLPFCRGLDAVKWAIINKCPIGVTTHLIGEEIDAGEIIDRKIVSIRFQDTFHAVTQRVYETEIDMLVAALEKINEKHEYIDGSQYPLHRRMCHEIEMNLMECFEELRKMSAF